MPMTTKVYILFTYDKTKSIFQIDVPDTTKPPEKSVHIFLSSIVAQTPDINSAHILGSECVRKDLLSVGKRAKPTTL